jgi:hypothetical protein
MLTLVLAALVQTATPLPGSLPSQDQPPAQPTARVAAANGVVAAQADARTLSVAEINQDRAAAMTADRAAYRAAVMAHAATLIDNQVRYEQQEAAYADAMWAWRQQVRACKRGNSRVCNQPVPSYDAYY